MRWRIYEQWSRVFNQFLDLTSTMDCRIIHNYDRAWFSQDKLAEYGNEVVSNIFCEAFAIDCTARSIRIIGTGLAKDHLTCIMNKAVNVASTNESIARVTPAVEICVAEGLATAP